MLFCDGVVSNQAYTIYFVNIKESEATLEMGPKINLPDFWFTYIVNNKVTGITSSWFPFWFPYGLMKSIMKSLKDNNV